MFGGYEDAYPYGAGNEPDGYADPLVSTDGRPLAIAPRG
jgi:hypothetical protein